MSLYAIGDIQGCYTSFRLLLKRINFNPNVDKLWLVGDLVNRGPESLKVLQHVISLGDAAECVLGNHELHLLAVAAGVRPLSAKDTFDDILNAKNASKLIDWLRERPLIIHDEKKNRLLVHAGIPPIWSITRALKEASRVEALLRSDKWVTAVQSMYGNLPVSWSKTLPKDDRLRYAINGLTRMRYCDRHGRLAMEYSGPPGTQPKSLVPWFSVDQRKTQNTHIFFGHWSALGIIEGPNFTALDTGCVWGRRLTAVKLRKNTHPRIRVKCKVKK